MDYAIDTASLKRIATASGHGEHFEEMARFGGCSIGIGARLNSNEGCEFFIEVSLQFCQRDTAFNIDELNRLTDLLRSLKARGYSVACEMGLVTCEKEIREERIEDELGSMLTLARSCFTANPTRPV